MIRDIVVDIDQSTGNGLVIVMSPYNPQDVPKFKSAGYRWTAVQKMWRAPLTLDSCQALRREFGDRLAISPELRDWAWAERRKTEALAELAKATSATLHVTPSLSPLLAEKMAARTYQQVGARFIAEAGNCLIADEPGLGKTLEAISGLMEAGKWHGPILIAAPLTSLRTTWLRELTRFTPDAHVTVGVALQQDSAGMRRALMQDWLDGYLATPAEAHVLVINPEMVREAQTKFPVIMGITWTAIIVDESHKYLTGVRSVQNLTKTGAAMLALKGDTRIAMSGTPMRGKPRNLWGTLHWLRPAEYSSFWRWADRYLVVEDTRYGKKIGTIRRGREDDLYRSLDKIMLRRTKAEVVTELPPKAYIDVICDMPAAQARQYTQMSKQAFAELGDEKLTAAGVLAIMTRMKQMATCAWGSGVNGKPTAKMRPEVSGKTAVIEQMLIERGIAGDDREGMDKIVIASQFTEVIDSLGEFLESIKVEFMKITGAVKESHRVLVTETFQAEGGPRVLLMNTMAGGVSITLDEHCDELIIIDETWTPDDQEQLEDRIHRVSRIHQVMIYKLITADSIDEYIKEVTIAKDVVQKTLLDGRRGVDLAVRLLGR